MLLQKIRDEAHRFAITFHRVKRAKATFTTELETIEGIGKKTADKLLSHFKSWTKIKDASEDELISIVGKSASFKIKQFVEQQAADGITLSETSIDQPAT
jgi:excinuclease ABC subunit C